MNAIDSINELVKALEAGAQGPLISGSPLVIESLEPVMRVVEFCSDDPWRMIDGKPRPILGPIFGRYYSFEYNPTTLELRQITTFDAFHLWGWELGRMVTCERKRLTPYMLRKVARKFRKRWRKRRPKDL